MPNKFSYSHSKAHKRTKNTKCIEMLGRIVNITNVVTFFWSKLLKLNFLILKIRVKIEFWGPMVCFEKHGIDLFLKRWLLKFTT